MVNKNGPSGPQQSAGQKPRRRKSKSSAQKQGLIILPAIKASEGAIKRAEAIVKSDAQKTEPEKKAALAPRVISQPASSTADQKQSTQSTCRAEPLLPEYRAQTNGLRELLSSIDPSDSAYHSPVTSFEPTIENAMHIPHSRPGIPGSPDLPVGPTRWGLYLSGAIGALAFVFVSALAWTHLSSPTGINWAKMQSSSGDAYQWAATRVSKETKTHTATIVRNDEPELRRFENDALIATASRISTTAATPAKGSIKTPSANDIFISPQELENQIRALEGSKTKKPKHMLAAPTLPKKKRVAARKKNVPEYEQLMVIPAANIDPGMESQIFKRASSYLKQRDISSARMILQYAATLGSGISAMALAETFDPNYLKKTNLHGVAGNEADARKWYDMAARLGIKEANARLTALK